MQAAQGFGRRGVNTGGAAAQNLVAPSSEPLPTQLPENDAVLAAFQAAAKADWADARKTADRTPLWKRYPGMTALAVMIVMFTLITLTPLHLSLAALRWIRGGLTVSGLFGFGAKRLFRKKKGAG